MGIILFLVDTSASMNQRTFLGTSYLDVAKGAIDTFMKVRMRGRGREARIRKYRSGVCVTRVCNKFLSCVVSFAGPGKPGGSIHVGVI